MQKCPVQYIHFLWVTALPDAHHFTHAVEGIDDKVPHCLCVSMVHSGGLPSLVAIIITRAYISVKWPEGIGYVNYTLPSRRRPRQCAHLNKLFAHGNLRRTIRQQLLHHAHFRKYCGEVCAASPTSAITTLLLQRIRSLQILLPPLS